MEEARSLVPRLVELAFVPERMAGEMLAQAFAWLTCVDDPRPEGTRRLGEAPAAFCDDAGSRPA